MQHDRFHFRRSIPEPPVPNLRKPRRRSNPQPREIARRDLNHPITTELMTSRDGFDWDRNFRDVPFLGRSAAGLFDSRSLFTNSTPVVLDDEIRSITVLTTSRPSAA